MIFISFYLMKFKNIYKKLIFLSKIRFNSINLIKII